MSFSSTIFPIIPVTLYCPKKSGHLAAAGPVRPLLWPCSLFSPAHSRRCRQSTYNHRSLLTLSSSSCKSV